MITSTELLTDSFVKTRFWRNSVSCEFPKPMCFIGQTVLHDTKYGFDKIMIPVKVVGLFWTGMDWEFTVKLPKEHPQYSVDEKDEGFIYDVITLPEWQIISIS